MNLKLAVQLARPKHWIKNVVVLFPVVLSMRMGDGAAWGDAALAVLAFCFACSGCYIFNDIFDRKKDRLHPQKKTRPIAAGLVSLSGAGAEALVLLALAGLAIACTNVATAAVLGVYVLLQLAYTLKLKHLILLDVICIALGFVLRAVAGALAIGAAVSPWLFVCTFTLCLFMGFCKRRCEANTLGQADQAGRHRPVLQGYTPELLTHLITLCAGVAVIGFLLYSTSPATVERFGTTYMLYTLPVMVYAVFRFAMLSISGTYMDPTELIFRDRPFQLAVAVWVVAMVCIVRWGHDLQLALARLATS